MRQILRFQEQYVERIWGGDKLAGVLGKSLPSGPGIGESWMIADHPSCESVVLEGPAAGRTLRELMCEDAMALLGTCARATPSGRFPLLLKLIDAGDVLSVQAHPNDEQAAWLGESDIGKTEMWHVLDAAPDARLTSGLRAGVTRSMFESALKAGAVAEHMASFPVTAGDAVFVAAGMVHAIGGGILLAEIQQNSDITYRLFDWNRVDDAGRSRELHIDKGLSILNFERHRTGRVAPLRYTESGVVREVLSACSYFAAERVRISEKAAFTSAGRSFHIFLALDAPITLRTDDATCSLSVGEAALIPACMPRWEALGSGHVLDYYVPDLMEDIVVPLGRHGYGEEQIGQLGDVTLR